MARLRWSVTGDCDEDGLIRHWFPSGNYTQVTTAKSRRVYDEKKCVVFSQTWMGSGLLSILSRVRSHVKKRVNEGLLKTTKVHIPKYWGVSPKLNSQWTDALELDISAAYLKAAHKLGAISEEVYEWLYSKSKQVRLTAMGALGTEKTLSVFKKGKQVSSEFQVDKDLRGVWESLVREVDATMAQVAKTAGRGFLFYWVDCVMVKRDVAPTVRKAIIAAGYESHEVGVTIRRHKKYLLCKDGRFFTLPKKGEPNEGRDAVSVSRV